MRQGVPHPRGMQRHIEGRGHGEFRRNGQTVANVSATNTTDGCVDREFDRAVAGRLDPVEQVVGDGTVFRYVQLEPIVPPGSNPLQVFRAGGAECGENKREVVIACDGRGGFLSGVMHHARESGGTETDREIHRRTEERCRRVHVRNVDQSSGTEFNGAEKLALTQQSEFLAGGAVGVVEHRPWSESLRDGADIAQARRSRESPLSRVQIGGFELREFSDFRPSRNAHSPQDSG